MRVWRSVEGFTKLDNMKNNNKSAKNLTLMQYMVNQMITEKNC
jgi:hypothetical protein